MSEKKEAKVLVKTIGRGQSRSKNEGEFVIRRETSKTAGENDRKRFIIIGLKGDETPCNTAMEVVNFCLAVFKRKIDYSALRSGAVEFLDDEGSMSRSDKSKLNVVSKRLDRAIESLHMARGGLLKGDFKDSAIDNLSLIEQINNCEEPISELIDEIKNIANPPKSEV